MVDANRPTSAQIAQPARKSPNQRANRPTSAQIAQPARDLATVLNHSKRRQAKRHHPRNFGRLSIQVAQCWWVLFS